MAIEAPTVPGRAPGEARPRPKREREEEVLVWPDLVFVEFIAATLFTITFLMLSVFINAPLLNRANPDVTPNPSKAPWYFLNLQELLLHMDKAWAGVLLPTLALGFFAVIP
jgi:menaquinol-cytochrome c reductase cytochrome b/c subunit